MKVLDSVEVKKHSLGLVCRNDVFLTPRSFSLSKQEKIMKWWDHIINSLCYVYISPIRRKLQKKDIFLNWIMFSGTPRYLGLCFLTSLKHKILNFPLTTLKKTSKNRNIPDFKWLNLYFEWHRYNVESHKLRVCLCGQIVKVVPVRQSCYI